MPEDEKARIDDIAYAAPNGESWKEVADRANTFFSSLPEESSHMIFTHGGLICSLTFDLGLEDMPSNGDVIGVRYSEEFQEVDELAFHWEFPGEELN
jgi:broad specificity phosphatase PhoE